MKLRNAFNDDVRMFWFNHYWCAKCNRSDLPIEIHHIIGRGSDSILNSVPICKTCHIQIGHTDNEERTFFAYVFKRCYNTGWRLNENDFQFIRENYGRLFTKELSQWLGE